MPICLECRAPTPSAATPAGGGSAPSSERCSLCGLPTDAYNESDGVHTLLCLMLFRGTAWTHVVYNGDVSAPWTVVWMLLVGLVCMDGYVTSTLGHTEWHVSRCGRRGGLASSMVPFGGATVPEIAPPQVGEGQEERGAIEGASHQRRLSVTRQPYLQDIRFVTLASAIGGNRTSPPNVSEGAASVVSQLPFESPQRQPSSFLPLFLDGRIWWSSWARSCAMSALEVSLIGLAMAAVSTSSWLGRSIVPPTLGLVNYAAALTLALCPKFGLFLYAVWAPPLVFLALVDVCVVATMFFSVKTLSDGATIPCAIATVALCVARAGFRHLTRWAPLSYLSCA